MNSETYVRLVRLAREIRSQTGFSSDTLATHDLAHEAYMRVKDGYAIRSPDAFYGHVMRRVITDYLRGKLSVKRGGQYQHATLPEQLPADCIEIEDILTINKALSELKTHDPLAVNIVELVFFAGYTYSDTARILEISEGLVRKRLKMALRLIDTFVKQ